MRAETGIKSYTVFLVSLCMAIFFSSCKVINTTATEVKTTIVDESNVVVQQAEIIFRRNRSIDETIELTAFSKALLDQVKVEDCKQMLMPGYFEKVVEQLKNQDELRFPECDIKNSLDDYELKHSYGKTRVFTIRKDESFDKVILYLPGGAGDYNLNKYQVEMVDKIVKKTNACVYIPMYSLSPQTSFKEIYECLDAVYNSMDMDDKELIIMGDSVGGTFAAGFCEYLGSVGKRIPDKQILISACMDATFSNPQIPEFEKKDKLLASYGCRQVALLLAEGEDISQDYRARPMYGNLDFMPTTLVIIGDEDIMYPDNKLFCSMLRENGGKVKFVTGKGLCHDFSIFDVNEGNRSVEIMAKFIE